MFQRYNDKIGNILDMRSVRKETKSKMTPVFLAQSTHRLELLFSEGGKTIGCMNCKCEWRIKRSVWGMQSLKCL